MIRIALLATLMLTLSTSPQWAAEPEWVAPMRKVHAQFKGTPGYVAQFGDSITYSNAFWTPLDWDEPQKYLPANDPLPAKPATGRWRDWVKGTRGKGAEHANYSGWKVTNLLKAMDSVLQREKPELALVMIGTNDISGGKLPENYAAGLREVVEKCLAAHCVPILNTIPPRTGHEEAVEAANRVIRDVAARHQVPLVDYHAEVVRLRPEGSWKGTLISNDGIHPTGGKSNVYTPENLSNSGYALRNWLNFLAVREVYFRVLHPVGE